MWARVGLALATLVWAAAAQAGWRVAETERFRIYSQAGEAELRETARLLEDYDALLRLYTGLSEAGPPPSKLDVFVAGGELTRGTRQVGDVLGFYAASPLGVGAFVREGRLRGDEADDVLLHEYAHHFQQQHFPNAYPAWFIEGFAEYFMTANFDERTVEVGTLSKSRVRAFQHQRWIPLKRLLLADAKTRATLPAGIFYAQSWLFVHYAFRDPTRRKALVTFLEATARGEDGARAFRAAFGRDFSEVDRELQRYGRRGMHYSILARPSVADPTRVTVRELPPAADALLLPWAKLRLGIYDLKSERRELERLRRVAARFADDPFAQRTLALAEMAGGDAEAAGRILDRLIAADPRDGEALLFKGQSVAMPGRTDPARRLELFRAARPFFVRAHAVNPDHAPTLFAYAETQLAEPRTPDENTLNVLLLARQLLPQVIPYNLAAGYVLLWHRRFEEAEQVLSRVAFHPHGGELAVRAQALLAQARSRTAPVRIEILSEEEAQAADVAP